MHWIYDGDNDDDDELERSRVRGEGEGRRGTRGKRGPREREPVEWHAALRPFHKSRAYCQITENYYILAQRAHRHCERKTGQ